MREEKWDFTKAVLMIIVIFGHVCPALSGNTYTDDWCALTRITGLFVMPLFFFISGYFQSCINGFRGLLKKYEKSFFRIGVPLIAWGGGVYIIFRVHNVWAASSSDSVNQQLISFVRQSIVSSISFYWFLSALLICILIGSLLKFLCVSFPKLGLTVLLMSLFCSSFLRFDYFYFSFVWFFYGSGMVFKLLEIKIEKYKHKKILYAVITALSILCVVIGYSFDPKYTFYYTSNLIRETSFGFIILRYILCLNASLCALYWIFRLFNRYKSKKIVKYLTLSGQETLFIYCAHVLILSIIIKPIIEQMFGEQGILVSMHYMLIYIVSPIITFILYYILNQFAVYLKRFGVLRALFMGLPIK